MSASYQYQPLIGPLPGASFEEQTKAFLRDAASRAEWGNVEGKPDLEVWLAGVDDRLAELDGRATANGQEAKTALSGMEANAAAIAALQDGASDARADRAALRSRVDAAERNEAELRNRVGVQEQAGAGYQTDIAALLERVTVSEAGLAAARNEAAGAAQAAQAARTAADAHHRRHATDGADALAPADIGAAAATVRIEAGAGLTGGGDLTANRSLAVKYGTAAGTACQGDDARLSNARSPVPHRNTHKAGGADALSPADIGAAPAARGVPVGLVGLWNGETPPVGWAVCNGANGTPNLAGYVAGTLHYIQFKG